MAAVSQTSAITLAMPSSLSIRKILRKQIKSTFTDFPPEISAKILENILPSPKVDEYGRQYLSSYPASLSRQAFMLLYLEFQPVLIQTNNAWFLQTRLAFGVPFKLIESPIPRTALILGINHELQEEKVNAGYAVTGAKYLPNLISMINGVNYTRMFNVPSPRRDIVASITSIRLEYRAEVILRENPSYLNKLFDGIKGLQMYPRRAASQPQPPGPSHRSVRIRFIAPKIKDRDKRKEIREAAATPALTVEESEAEAKRAMDEGKQGLEHKHYAESMMWFGLSANTLGRNIFYHDPGRTGLFYRPGPHEIMVELSVLFAKAAAGLDNTLLVCQFLERARVEALWLRSSRIRNFPSSETEIRLVMDIVLGMLETRLLNSLEFAAGLVEKILWRHPASQVLLDAKASIEQARLQYVLDMMARDSYEGYSLAIKASKKLLFYRHQSSPELDALYDDCSSRIKTITPAVVRAFVEEDAYDGYLKAQALFSSSEVKDTWDTAVLQAKVDCDFHLVACCGLKAATMFELVMISSGNNPYLRPEWVTEEIWSPKKYFTAAEVAILEQKETAKCLWGSLQPKNPRKRKAEEISEINENRVILKRKRTT